MLAYMNARKPSSTARISNISSKSKRERSQKGECSGKGPPSTLSHDRVKCDKIGADIKTVKVFKSQPNIREFLVSREHSLATSKEPQKHSLSDHEEGKGNLSSKLKCQE